MAVAQMLLYQGLCGFSELPKIAYGQIQYLPTSGAAERSFPAARNYADGWGKNRIWATRVDNTVGHLSTRAPLRTRQFFVRSGGGLKRVLKPPLALFSEVVGTGLRLKTNLGLFW